MTRDMDCFNSTFPDDEILVGRQAIVGTFNRLLVMLSYDQLHRRVDLFEFLPKLFRSPRMVPMFVGIEDM